MKISKSTVMFYLSIFSVYAWWIFSLVNSDNTFLTFGILLVAAPLAAFTYLVNTEEMKTKALIFLLSLVLFTAVFTLNSILTDSSPVPAALQNAASFLFFLLPLNLSVFQKEKGRLERLIPFLIHLVITLPLLRESVNTYSVLYRDIQDYTSFQRYMIFASLSLILSSAADLIGNTKRNPVSFFLILVSALFSYRGAKAAGEVYPITSPVVLILVLESFIYIARGETTRYSIERKKIVLSTLEFREIEHLKKKVKPRVYEIPPNLPTNDEENSSI